MAGTILITGANSSLAIPACQYLLREFPNHAAVLTVRNASRADVNTNQLRETVAQYPEAKVSIYELDLAHLPAVHDFAKLMITEVSKGNLPPISGLICNAYYWNLVGDRESTAQGYDKTFQVNHLAQAALVLRLLGSFGPHGGRVVLFSSDAHWPGKSSLEKYPPAIPEDADLLAKPGADDPVDNFGHGFQRYANSKLAVVMWMYALNRHLEKDPKLSSITAVAINPGNLSDSRALRVNTPRMLLYMSMFIIRPLRLLLRFVDPTMRTSAEAGVDVIALATDTSHPKDRGYFTLLTKDTSAPDSMNVEKQEMLWAKTIEWACIPHDETAFKN